MTRPKVEDWLQGDNRILLEGWARNGLTDNQMADNLGISRTTFYKWKNINADFANILKRNKEVVDTEVENALYKAAISGNTTAMIFWLKNRKYKDWRDKHEDKSIEEDDNEYGIIEIPSVGDGADE